MVGYNSEGELGVMLFFLHTTRFLSATAKDVEMSHMIYYSKSRMSASQRIIGYQLKSFLTKVEWSVNQIITYLFELQKMSRLEGRSRILEFKRTPSSSPIK